MTDQVNEAVAWTDDAQKWGKALNEASWTFIETCPEKSPLLFNTAKGALRAAILRYAEFVAAVNPALAHPARGVVDEVALAEVIQDHTGCGDSDSIYAAHAVIQHLQAAALPAVPEGANGKAFSVGDRVVWTSRFGREFTGVVESVIEPVPTRYTVKLDDGLHADCDAWNLAATPKDQSAPRPKQREVARIGDMHQADALRVGLDGDGDAYVCCTGDGVEFCTTGSGGGKSPRTHDALIALMVAMEADNAETPSRDWWKKRLAATPAHDQPEGSDND